MERKPDYYLVDTKALPEVFIKVMEVKKILAAGKAGSVHEAVKTVGLSRSAYYKYKDSIFPFFETSRGKVLTLLLVVEDIPGNLSMILQKISKTKSNILTIHQNIPIHGLADIIITLETRDSVLNIQELLNEIGEIEGVKRHEIVARE